MQSGDRGIVINLMGNILIANGFLPAGKNMGLGYGKNEEKGKLYYFNWNEHGFHGIYCYDGLTGGITPVLQNLIDTNNVDILRFSPDYLINHVDIVTDKLIYWVDGLNKARKFNINKAIDKSATGYGTVITEDFITAYKKTGIYAPTVEYFTDLSRTSNYLYAKQFKFTYRYYYDDGEISNWSDWSAVAFPPNESYLGQNAITFANNGLQVTVETGDRLVIKIEISVSFTEIDLVSGTGFVSCVVLNKKQLNIADYANYTYSFYNDGAFILLDQSKIIRPFNYMPRIPKAQSFVKIAMTYSHAVEGYDEVQVSASVAITYNAIFIPDGEIDQLNHPFISINLTSNTKHGGLFNTWWTTVSRFTIGSDVKKGNKFQVNARGGHGYRHFEYLAGLSDSASTVANAIKQWLRTIDGAGTGTMSNETLDGDGNEIWDFTIEAHEGDNSITFDGTVNSVNFSTLKDNGLSVNVIKQGSTCKYGFVYSDDDGREEPTYTADSLLVKTPFQTEVLLGTTQPLGLKQAVHTISVFHKPPVWAKWYRVVRSKDTDTFIELLIQQVNTVEVANEDTYLDMVVGSLFTYQKIHPDTILKYDFQRGDRLRLISDNSGDDPIPYTPYFETEVLNYSTETEEAVNANIVVDGTDHVQPDKAVDENYIGKFIVINSVERLITGVDGAKYVLDKAFKPNVNFGDGTAASVTYPNYKFIDRRGIIRIKKPVGYNVVSLSMIEVYRPQQNTNNQNYQDFFDFQQKYEVLSYGTEARAHQGNIQNQSGNTPAKVQVTQGNSFIRNRAMPSNNDNPNPQVIIDKISDPNFSDFYTSNLYSAGRVYPQAQSTGQVDFGSRVRFSNNYIEDTQVNGLNDFDSLDRIDYNDPYGTITRTLFRGDYLYIFKQLCPAWTPVGKKIIKDNQGNELLATSEKLLNDLQYSTLECGMGDNGEGLVINKNSLYIPSAYAGVFVRMAQNGSIAISEKYFYDSVAREVLGNVSKYKLNIFGGYCSEHDEVHWTVPPFIKYDFNNAFNAGDWQTVVNAYPAGTTFEITQQPAHSVATVVDGVIQITGTSTLGNDVFKFRGILPGGGFTPVMNFCFTVVESPNRVIDYRVRDSSLYCVRTGDTPLDDFDFLVLRYIWDAGSGTDLDTFTGFVGTGTPYDGDPLSRTNWVGYNQNPVPPATNGVPPENRVIPQGSASPYLNWGTDNTGPAGVEAILIDIKQFNIDLPASANPVRVKMNAVWYGARESGSITIEVKTYLGGTMALVGTDFVNTGGVLVDDISYPANIISSSTSSLIANSQAVAELSYNKTTNEATLTLA